MSVDFSTTPWKLVPHPKIDNSTIFSLENGPGLIAKKLTTLSWIGEKEFNHELEMHVKAKELLPDNVPGVVGLFPNGDGEWIYVQEEVIGEPLEQYSQSKSVDELMPVINQILEKLHFFHSKGFMHGDLHGGNFIIDKDEKVWIIDFGCSELSENRKFDDYLEVNRRITVNVDKGTVLEPKKTLAVTNPLAHYLKTKKRVKILNSLNKSSDPRIRALTSKYISK